MLDERAYSRARKLAAEQGVSISHVVCEALEKYNPEPNEKRRHTFTIFSGEGEGFIAPVDPNSYAQLEEFMDLEWWREKERRCS